MKMESRHRKSSILTPILIGSAVGAGIALMVAPKSGKELRKDLKRFSTNTQDMVADVIDEGRDLYEEGREVVDRAVKAGRETYEEGAERIEKLMHKKERSFMAPILASSIIGAGVAFLMAPKAGKEIRKDLKRFSENTRDQLISALDKGKALYLKGRKNIPEAVKAGKKAYVHEKVKFRHAA